MPGLKSIDRLRRRRNQAEYPEPSSAGPITADEAEAAIARSLVSASTPLPGSLLLPELGIF